MKTIRETNEKTEEVLLDQNGEVTLSLTPHVMATTKNGRQYRKSIGYWIVRVSGKDVACYQDSPKRAIRARAEFNRIKGLKRI